MRILRYAFLAGFLFIMGCGGGGNGTGDGGSPNAQPSQVVVNEDIQRITDYVLRLSFEIDGSSCSLFNQSAATFPGVFACSGGGDTIITIQQQDCEDGPPFDAQLLLQVSLDDCTSTTGSIATGGFFIDYRIQENTGDAFVTSTTYEEDGLSYILNLGGTVNEQGIVTCAGTAKVNGYTCEVSEDWLV